MFGFSIGFVIAAAIAAALVFYGLVNVQFTDEGWTIRQKVREFFKGVFGSKE